jgi:hypothetical protein
MKGIKTRVHAHINEKFIVILFAMECTSIGKWTLFEELLKRDIEIPM